MLGALEEEASRLHKVADAPDKELMQGKVRSPANVRPDSGVAPLDQHRLLWCQSLPWIDML